MRIGLRTAVGFALGVGAGLGLAGGVWSLVLSLPAPEMRAAFRTEAHDDVEAARNVGWDPNAPLRLKPLDPAVLERTGAEVLASLGTAGAGVSQRIRDIQQESQGAHDDAGVAAAPDLPVLNAPRTRSFVGLAVIETQLTGDLEKLRRMRTRLLERGVEARIVRQSTDETYSLRIGPFSSDSELAEARQKLMDSGL